MNTQPNPFLETSLKTVVKWSRWLGLVVVVAILFSGVTFVHQDEVALVLRFGRLVGSTPGEQIRQPGLHFAFPYLIDEVIRVPVSRVQEVTVDGLYSHRHHNAIGEITDTGYAITGDENIVLLSAVVKYQITDPIAYALEVADPKQKIQEITTSSLMQNAASMPVDDILVRAQNQLEIQTLQDAQGLLDQLEMGVQLLALEFVNIQPPTEVRSKFDAVTNAQVQKQTQLQRANEYKEEQIPRAQAKRDELIQQAQSFKVSRIAQAQSEVREFYALLEEYRLNPDILTQRLYLDKVDNILSNVGLKIVLPSGEEERIILPGR